MTCYYFRSKNSHKEKRKSDMMKSMNSSDGSLNDSYPFEKKSKMNKPGQCSFIHVIYLTYFKKGVDYQFDYTSMLVTTDLPPNISWYCLRGHTSLEVVGPISILSKLMQSFSKIVKQYLQFCMHCYIVRWKSFTLFLYQIFFWKFRLKKSNIQVIVFKYSRYLYFWWK